MHVEVAPTIDDLARWLVESANDEHRWAAIGEFLDRFRELEPDRRTVALRSRPRTTGSRQWDAFLVGLAEWLAWTDDLAQPTWIDDTVSEPVFFVSSFPSQRAWALTASPAAFRRHGVFLHPDDLTRA